MRPVASPKKREGQRIDFTFQGMLCDTEGLFFLINAVKQPQRRTRVSRSEIESLRSEVRTQEMRLVIDFRER